jgi:hypothetical protein
VNQTQPDKLQATVAHCREAYAAFQQLAARTEAALYEALGAVYTLLWQIQTDAAVGLKFEELLQPRPCSSARSRR